MGFAELFIIAVGLSMDAFAVSVCKGLSMKKMSWKNAVVTGLYFGGFQALMPVLGFFLGYRFRGWVEEIDHWIAFVLLTLIGVSMIREAFGQGEDLDDSFGVKAMLPLAVATSIDAFAVGVSFAFLNVAIAFAASFIGVTTFVLSFAGIRVGNVFGKKYESGAEIAGGVILIIMGIKTLLEHLGILP